MGMRHAVLVLSMGTVVLYGYALAGLGGYMMGRGRPDYIAFGLIFGTLSGAAAIFFVEKIHAAGGSRFIKDRRTARRQEMSLRAQKAGVAPGGTQFAANRRYPPGLVSGRKACHEENAG